LIFEGFTSKLGERVVTVLKHLFPPRDGAVKIGNRVVTFVVGFQFCTSNSRRWSRTCFIGDYAMYC
jgi:hypothetical protein